MPSRQFSRGGRADKSSWCLWSSSNVPNTICVLNTDQSAHLSGSLIRGFLPVHRQENKGAEMLSNWTTATL